MDYAQKIVEHMFAHDPFSQWLGIEIVAVELGKVTTRLQVREEMLNGFSVSHGGIVFSLTDSTLAFAANTHGQIAMTIESNISYPSPIFQQDILTAKAEEVHSKGRLAIYHVTVSKQDQSLAAIFKGTVYRTKKKHFT